jgi:hypothetical protein
MPTPIRPEPGETCRNCGTTLLGPWCHECGQSLKSPIRELGTLIVDGVQQVLDIDNKMFRSLLPLYFRPGWLTQRYLDGQRCSFIRPLRMYIGLSVILFFSVAFWVDVPDVDRGGGPSPIQVQVGDTRIDPISGDAVTPAKPPATPTSEAPPEPAASPAAAAPRNDNASATTAPDAPSPPNSTPATADSNATPAPAELPEERRARIAKRVREATINFDGQPWDPVTHPLRFEFLSDAANHWINRRITIGRERVIDYMVDPARFVDVFIATLPSAMFLLLPLFALLLKFMYPFSRRLYVEHLIVALHSHSFLFFGFIGMLTLGTLGSWIPTLSNFSTTLIVGGAIWMPIYLFLMQKRVYRQGWWMTLFKYSLIGTIYLFMITFALIGALLSSVLA